MLRQFIHKRCKIHWGLIQTYVLRRTLPYSPGTWWDGSYYTRGVSDRATIAPDKNHLSARYHYASVEMLIFRHLFHAGIHLDNARVCDLGSGAGHWIDFYLSLGASSCCGVDISDHCVEHLRARHADNQAVEIRKGPLHEVVAGFKEEFDLINAIGVLFHIVDDDEWRRTIEAIAMALKPGGTFIAGGHFGWFNNVNLQTDAEGRFNKRLRSRRTWKRVLRTSGFESIEVHRNLAYLFIRDSLPENSILTATRGATLTAERAPARTEGALAQ